MAGRVLVVGRLAGTRDGVQADIDTVAALGGHATIAVTAMTDGHPGKAQAVLDVPAALLHAQLLASLASRGADAFKTGMLVDAARIEAVAAAFASHAGTPFVLDPMMVAENGHPLLAPDAVASLKRVLVPLASLVTPGVAEAEMLSGMTITTVADLERASEMLLTLGAAAVLVRGSEIWGDTVTDRLATEDGCELFTSARGDSRPEYGARCMLASAVATGLARGSTLRDAVSAARAYARTGRVLTAGSACRGEAGR